MEKVREVAYFKEQLDTVTYKYDKLISVFLNFLLKNCGIESIKSFILNYKANNKCKLEDNIIAPDMVMLIYFIWFSKYLD